MANPPELIRDEQGLALIQGDQVLRADFSHMLPRLRLRNLYTELLVKAVRIRGAKRPLQVVDATAGMAEDSLLLAAAGCTVRLYERDPLLAALVRDGLRRAQEDAALHDIVCRMELLEEDSIAALPRLNGWADVVYLDPMFPERRRRAATKKKLQLIQQLEKPCEDEEALMQAALAACPRKVVVKRPLKGPCLAGIKASYSLTGKVVRYDIVVRP